MSGDIDTLKDSAARIGGDVSRLTGADYESHVATYVHRFLRRSLGINATTFSTQRDKSALAALLDESEAHGIIDAQETDDLNLADLVLTSDRPTDYILAEVSITIQQDDIDRAAERARLLTKATARTVTPFRHWRARAAGPPKRTRPSYPYSGAPDSAIQNLMESDTPALPEN